MDIVYRVVSGERIDAVSLRAVVEIVMRSVVNGYGGGHITITVPVYDYQAKIEELVIKKLANGVAPQVHEFVLQGDVAKLDALMEPDRRAKEDARARDAREAEAREAQRQQEQQAAQAQVESGIAKAQEGDAPLGAEEQADVSVAPEESPLA